jgi:hypothetical protein
MIQLIVWGTKQLLEIEYSLSGCLRSEWIFKINLNVNVFFSHCHGRFSSSFLNNKRRDQSDWYNNFRYLLRKKCVLHAMAESHHFYPALAQCENFDAGSAVLAPVPDPTPLYKLQRYLF